MKPKKICTCCYALLALSISAIAENDRFFEYPSISTQEILKQRGYEVEDLYLTTKDSYKLNVVHAKNPLIQGSGQSAPKRVPILFVHGVLASSSCFVINSFDVEPKDFSSLDLSNDSVVDLIAKDPSSKSLPLLALNFGHEVYLINRRGVPGSREKVSANKEQAPSQTSTQGPSRLGQGQSSFDGALRLLPDEIINVDAVTSAISTLLDIGSSLQLVQFSFDRHYWNYSYDEQAEDDLPMLVNFIREQTGSQVAIVAHSAGGAITLMALAENPEIAENISSAILWSEAFSYGNGESIEILQPLLPFFEAYIGSIPTAFATPQAQAILDLICATKLAQSTFCELLFDLLLGSSGGKEPEKPEFINSMLFPSSSHEIAQTLQCARFGGNMHKFDFGSAEANNAKYNSPVPPSYNLSRLTLDKISFYVGRTDTEVTEADVRMSASMLNVPYNFHTIDTTFNHFGYFIHDDTARLSIIPSLDEIHRFSATY